MPKDRSAATTRGVASNGVAYERRGHGRPVVLIHGWCLNSRMWLYAEEALLAGHEVVTLDLAGFGRSSGLAGPYSIARYADDLAALLEELRLANAVLVGFAFGAVIALELAARGDANAAAVVSVGIPNASSSPYGKMPKAIRRDWPDFARRSAQALFHTAQSEATLGWLERMFSDTSVYVALETVSVLAVYDPLETVARIKVPVLFIHADNDQVAPVSLGQSCVARALNARIEVIADCGHLIVLDQKARFHEITQQFIETV